MNEDQKKISIECAKTISGKHLFSQSYDHHKTFGSDIHVYMDRGKIEVCLACGMVDDRKYREEVAHIAPEPDGTYYCPACRTEHKTGTPCSFMAEPDGGKNGI